MGLQCEISNVLGVVIPATETIRHKLYTVGGKTVATAEDHEAIADFPHGVEEVISTEQAKPGIRILGFTRSTGARHFNGEALVGYTVAEEFYIGHATELPPETVIDTLREKLQAELKEIFGLDFALNAIKLHLLCDWDQGDVKPFNGQYRD